MFWRMAYAQRFGPLGVVEDADLVRVEVVGHATGVAPLRRRPLKDDPVVAGENASDLALVALCQEFHAHPGIITDILFGSGYAGLGHKDVETTMVYTHVLNRGGRGGCAARLTVCGKPSPARAGLGRPAGRPNPDFSPPPTAYRLGSEEEEFFTPFSGIAPAGGCSGLAGPPAATKRRGESFLTRLWTFPRHGPSGPCCASSGP
jgi:hypothetical protein